MTEKGGKKESAPATPEPAAENGAESELVQFGSWEFVDRIPGREEVLELLQTLPPRWGVKVADYLEYLTPLPQSKKTKVKVGKNLVEQSVPVYVLYVSVAGREAMLQAAEELNRWRVSFVPEPVTPTGVPGWLQNDDRRLVYREYCLAPGSRVLTSGLLWQAVETLQTGDTLVGFDEAVGRPGGRESFYCLATVTAMDIVAKPSVRVVTDRGFVVCSADHQWLVSRVGHGRRWIRAADLRTNDRIVGYSTPWLTDRSRDGGWMAGFLDGEGSVRLGGVGFAQNQGIVLDNALVWLKEHGYRASTRQQDKCVKVSILGGRGETARLLGSLQPLRLMQRSDVCWTGRAYGKVPTLWFTVHDVESVGVQDVVAVQTDTGTFIAEGMLSHNCEIYEPVVSAVDGAVDTVKYELKGRKPGTAWVPQTGGKQAAGSNPVEKVETSARGRALAAWGFGVLPGSGVASLDEIQQAAENMLAQQQRHQEGQQEQASSSGRPTREKLLEVTMQTMEEARMLRHESEYTADQRIIDHCQRRYGVNVAKPDADPELPPTVEWTRLNDGQLQLLTRAVQRSITEIRAQEQDV